MAPPLHFQLGDQVQTRKAHPCGGDVWEVVRLGAVIGLRCLTCGRRVLLTRSMCERRIKRFVHRADGAAVPAAVAPEPAASADPDLSDADVQPVHVPLGAAATDDGALTAAAVQQELEAAAAGLFVMSESDYPFEPYGWTGRWPPEPTALAVALGYDPDAPVEAGDLAAFFAAQSATYDWQDDADRARAARFAALGGLIQQRLSDLVFYRVGTIEITAVILGRVGTETVGLRTTLIET